MFVTTFCFQCSQSACVYYTCINTPVILACPFFFKFIMTTFLRVVMGDGGKGDDDKLH